MRIARTQSPPCRGRRAERPAARTTARSTHRLFHQPSPERLVGPNLRRVAPIQQVLREGGRRVDGPAAGRQATRARPGHVGVQQQRPAASSASVSEATRRRSAASRRAVARRRAPAPPAACSDGGSGSARRRPPATLSRPGVGWWRQRDEQQQHQRQEQPVQRVLVAAHRLRPPQLAERQVRPAAVDASSEPPAARVSSHDRPDRQRREPRIEQVEAVGDAADRQQAPRRSAAAPGAGSRSGGSARGSAGRTEARRRRRRARPERAWRRRPGMRRAAVQPAATMSRRENRRARTCLRWDRGESEQAESCGGRPAGDLHLPALVATLRSAFGGDRCLCWRLCWRVRRRFAGRSARSRRCRRAGPTSARRSASPPSTRLRRCRSWHRRRRTRRPRSSPQPATPGRLAPVRCRWSGRSVGRARAARSRLRRPCRLILGGRGRVCRSSRRVVRAARLRRLDRRQRRPCLAGSEAPGRRADPVLATGWRRWTELAERGRRPHVGEPASAYLYVLPPGAPCCAESERRLRRASDGGSVAAPAVVSSAAPSSAVAGRQQFEHRAVEVVRTEPASTPSPARRSLPDSPRDRWPDPLPSDRRHRRHPGRDADHARLAAAAAGAWHRKPRARSDRAGRPHPRAAASPSTGWTSRPALAPARPHRYRVATPAAQAARLASATKPASPCVPYRVSPPRAGAATPACCQFARIRSASGRRTARWRDVATRADGARGRVPARPGPRAHSPDPARAEADGR